MKVTVVKIVKPMNLAEGHVDLNNVQREKKAVLFFDPWVHPGSAEWDNLITKLNRHLADIANQANSLVATEHDIIYTINGVGHFHDVTVRIIDELRNYHYTDYATYQGVVNSYCCGRQCLFKHYKDSGNTKMKSEYQTRKHHCKVTGFRRYRNS